MPEEHRCFFITGAAALATASIALNLSIQNEKQIKEIRENVEIYESKLGHMRTVLANRINYQDEMNDHLVEATSNVYGYIRVLSQQVSSIPHFFYCWTQQNYAFNAVQSSLSH